MSQVAVWVKIPTKPGKRDDLANALKTALDTARSESETTYYILHEDPKEADVLWMYELYADQAALDAHMGTEAFKALGPVLGPFLAGAPEMKFLTPIDGKGL